jgi:hypothetical protein
MELQSLLKIQRLGSVACYEVKEKAPMPLPEGLSPSLSVSPKEPTWYSSGLDPSIVGAGFGSFCWLLVFSPPWDLSC